jgi:predicted secreted protein
MPTVNVSGTDVNLDARARRVITTVLETPFTIRLWEDRTRGEQWVLSFDTKGLTLLADEYLRIAGNNAVDNGQRTFEFKGLTPGMYQLVFEKRMGWKFTAEDRRVFTIEVMERTGG